MKKLQHLKLKIFKKVAAPTTRSSLQSMLNIKFTCVRFYNFVENYNSEWFIGCSSALIEFYIKEKTIIFVTKSHIILKIKSFQICLITFEIYHFEIQKLFSNHFMNTLKDSINIYFEPE